MGAASSQQSALDAGAAHAFTAFAASAPSARSRAAVFERTAHGLPVLIEEETDDGPRAARPPLESSEEAYTCFTIRNRRSSELGKERKLRPSGPLQKAQEDAEGELRRRSASSSAEERGEGLRDFEAAEAANRGGRGPPRAVP
ncbi:hypothetical protein BESB_048310 [Besnoitia besnoiti]|uniref:Uncharacterized protein n=1 Tax=Besnoitia besnoiti TaxID=94643 RepID=A0A2A9MFE0_BESBE|nr:hypothetical protein BESB_048310 [Besnoitia besnoiti]PFH36639.1 hypothetical protein BESB_048310 [Besnoitia besnoiti]